MRCTTHNSWVSSGLGLWIICLIAVALTPISEAGSGPTMQLLVPPANGPVEAGQVVGVRLRLTDLDGAEAAGFQAFLAFDDTLIQPVSAVYVAVTFGLPIITPIDLTSDEIDLAAGIDVFSGQSPVTNDAYLVVFFFEVLEDANCFTSLHFRQHDPPTRVTDTMGEAIEPLTLIGLMSGNTSDINNDGVVNVSDLLLMLAQFGACAPNEPCSADLNCDGTVNVSDLLQLLADFGPVP